MHDITPYAIIWIISVCASASSALWDDDYRHYRNFVGRAFTGGFVAIGVVSFLDYSFGRAGVDWTFGNGLYIGVSALAGALAKEYIEFASLILSKLRKP